MNKCIFFISIPAMLFLVSACYRGDNAKILLSENMRTAYQKARQINNEIESISMDEKEIDLYLVALKSGDPVIRDAARKALTYFSSVSSGRLLKVYNRSNCSDTLLKRILTDQIRQNPDVFVDSLPRLFIKKDFCTLEMFFKSNSEIIQRNLVDLTKAFLNPIEIIELYRQINIELKNDTLRMYRKKLLTNTLKDCNSGYQQKISDFLLSNQNLNNISYCGLKCDIFDALISSKTLDLTNLFFNLLSKSLDTILLEHAFTIDPEETDLVKDDKAVADVLDFIKKRDISKRVKDTAVALLIKIDAVKKTNLIVKILTDKSLSDYHAAALISYDKQTPSDSVVIKNRDLIIKLKLLFNNDEIHPIITKFFARSGEIDYLLKQSTVERKYKREIAGFFNRYAQDRKTYKKILFDNSGCPVNDNYKMGDYFINGLITLGYIIDTTANTNYDLNLINSIKI